MSCGVGGRCSSDLVLLWLWYRPAAAVLIRPLAWELPNAAGAAVKRKIEKRNAVSSQVWTGWVGCISTRLQPWYVRTIIIRKPHLRGSRVHTTCSISLGNSRFWASDPSLLRVPPWRRVVRIICKCTQSHNVRSLIIIILNPKFNETCQNRGCDWKWLGPLLSQSLLMVSPCICSPSLKIGLSI